MRRRKDLAFEPIPDAYALLEGCPTKCAVRRCSMGEHTGRLFVDTSAYFCLLTPIGDGRFKDSQDRDWHVYDLPDGRQGDLMQHRQVACVSN